MCSQDVRKISGLIVLTLTYHYFYLPIYTTYLKLYMHMWQRRAQKTSLLFLFLRSRPLLLALPSMPAEIWHLVSINNFSPGALLQTSTTQQSFACPVKSIIILASNGKNLSSLCINYADSTTRYSTHDDDGDAHRANINISVWFSYHIHWPISLT